jgi:hypothetical protein
MRNCSKFKRNNFQALPAANEYIRNRQQKFKRDQHHVETKNLILLLPHIFEAKLHSQSTCFPHGHVEPIEPISPHCHREKWRRHLIPGSTTFIGSNIVCCPAYSRSKVEAVSGGKCSSPAACLLQCQRMENRQGRATLLRTHGAPGRLAALFLPSYWNTATDSLIWFKSILYQVTKFLSQEMCLLCSQLFAL